MNHVTRVILTVSLSFAALLILLLNAPSAQPDRRQQAVLAYVAFKRATMAQPLTVGQYVLASMPQNFRAEMSRDSYGSSIYYQPAHRFGQVEQPNITFPLTATLPPTPTLAQVSYFSGMPIPYPPNDLWCVQLISPDPAAPKVVLAALHQDIYNAEWIVHEVTDPDKVLPAVGCKFTTQ